MGAESFAFDAGRDGVENCSRMPPAPRSAISFLASARLVGAALMSEAAVAAMVTKIVRLQQGQPSRRDCQRLDGLHRQMLVRIERMRRRASVCRPDSTARSLRVGASNAEVFLSDSDNAWSEEARREAGALRAVLGPEVDIHHIGSTAVAELAAKPIIDFAVALPRETFAREFPAVRRALENLGYRYLGQRGGLFFEKGPAPVRTHALQVHVIGGGVLAMLLHFRDLLRGSEDLRRSYADTKAALAWHLPRRRWIYAIYKGHWIQEQQWRRLGAAGWGEWFVAHRRAQAELAQACRHAR
jgi:GrpB-like predicted nucleotidyltransferase (UPF0157 family)